jgi:hypothetical protein
MWCVVYVHRTGLPTSEWGAVQKVRDGSWRVGTSKLGGSNLHTHTLT